eukprot:m51a1_g11816 hypothetical protein (106) ;mRNA; f:393250-393644
MQCTQGEIPTPLWREVSEEDIAAAAAAEAASRASDPDNASDSGEDTSDEKYERMYVEVCEKQAESLRATGPSRKRQRVQPEMVIDENAILVIAPPEHIVEDKHAA